MFLNGKIELLLYRDSDQTEFPQKELLNVTEQFNSTAVNNYQNVTIELAPSDIKTINFNSIGTTKYVYILSDTADINVNINTLGNIQFSFGVPSILGAAVGSLTIGNISSTESTKVSLSFITE